MLHKDVMALLFPVELAGDHSADQALEGRHLDLSQMAADKLLREMFPDSTVNLLVDWEALCGIPPATTSTRSERVDEVLFRLRSLGRLDRSYYIGIAAALGYTITITEPNNPTMADWAEAGGGLVDQEAIWIWEVTIAGGFTRNARASQASAGEPIEWYRDHSRLQDVFEELKPAHTKVIFV